MHIEKKSIKSHLFCLFFLLFYTNLSAGIYGNHADSSRYTPIDSTKKAYRLTNKNFNDIYAQNLRPSYIGQEFFDPHKTLLVGDLTASFVLFNTPKYPVYFVGVSRVNLRLFAGRGSPVKSPSYMPGGTLYFRLNKDIYKPSFLSVAYSHHSNGVEGPTAHPDGTINTDSGKFTTNFYTLTYHTGKRIDNKNTIINRYSALGLEMHSALIGLGYAHALKDRYGFLRVNGQWIYNIAKAINDPIEEHKREFINWQRIQLDFAYIADKYDNYNATDLRKRLNISLKYYYQFPFMQNTSFLIGGGYRGQDEYNIFFQDSYPYVMIGMSAGLSLGFHKN